MAAIPPMNYPKSTRLNHNQAMAPRAGVIWPININSIKHFIDLFKIINGTAVINCMFISEAINGHISKSIHPIETI
jgi:hypothetical protein